MKRLFALLSFFILPFIVFGDLLPEPEILISDEIPETNERNTDTNVAEESKDELDSSNEESTEEEFDPLRRIYFGFCDESNEQLTSSFNGIGEPLKPFYICLFFKNLSDRDISIDLSLVTTAIDDIGMTSCTLDKSFSEFLSSGNLGIITIPANNSIIKNLEITFPVGYQGEQHGCVAYRSPKEEGTEGIEIFVRKLFLMNFFIGSVNIKNEFTINDLTTKFDGNKDLIMSFWVENTGNMENTFDIQGTVKGLFGYNKPFEITDGQLAPGKSQFIEVNLGSLPSYGGKYNIDFTINGTPYFSYDISNANVDPARLEPKSWEFSTSVFKMPWLILAVVVIFILLLIVLFKKPKQKVVYVQQQPTQPVQPQQVQQQPTQQYTQTVQSQQSVQQPVQQPVQPTQPVQPQQPQNPNYPNQQ